MAWPVNLQVALKEWASVCDALEHGRQLVLLRKGGIHDDKGQFALEQREFLLFPTYLHQKREMLKPAAHDGIDERAAEPDEVHLSAVATVTDVVRVASRGQVDRLDDEHVWAPPLIDMRFDYRPTSPLYLVLLRVYRLGQPLPIANAPAYAGCRSWVPLEQSVATGGATPVLDDVKFEHRRRGILERLNGG